MSKISNVRVVVCTACREATDAEARPGAHFLEALRKRLTERAIDLEVEGAECLAVCKRPTTIVLAAHGKWTYVVADLDAQTQIDDVIDMGLRYAESENGIVAWKDRPVCFRKGVVSRIPPLP